MQVPRFFSVVHHHPHSTEPPISLTWLLIADSIFFPHHLTEIPHSCQHLQLTTTTTTTSFLAASPFLPLFKPTSIPARITNSHNQAMHLLSLLQVTFSLFFFCRCGNCPVDHRTNHGVSHLCFPFASAGVPVSIPPVLQYRKPRPCLYSLLNLPMNQLCSPLIPCLISFFAETHGVANHQPAPLSLRRRL